MRIWRAEWDDVEIACREGRRKRKKGGEGVFGCTPNFECTFLAQKLMSDSVIASSLWHAYSLQATNAASKVACASC